MVAHERRPLAVLGDRGEPVHGFLEGRGVLPREREVHRLHRVEVEDEVELAAAAAEEVPLLGRRQVHLAQQDGVAAPAAEVGAQVRQQLVGVLDRPLREPDRLDQEGHGVHPEAGEALLCPEARDLRELVPHLRVGDVQVGLLGVEAVQVPLARLLVVGPVRLLLVREDDVARLLLRLVVAPDVEAAVGESREERASWNHGWRTDVWLTTRSAMTRMPRSPAVRTMSAKSPSVPSFGSTP